MKMESLGFTMERVVYRGVSGPTPAHTPIYEDPPRKFPKSQNFINFIEEVEYDITFVVITYSSDM
jgi:hypothetical protein